MRMRMSLLAIMILVAPLPVVRAQQPAQKKPLDIYFLDTEGGQATLFVSPSGQSMLVDTGFPGNQGAPPAEANAPGVTRDADRIMAVLKLANVGVLDYVVITHYHGDHAGNAAELAHRIPIRHFVDHGQYTVEMQAGRDAPMLSYMPIREHAHVTTAKPGDKIPVEGLDVQVVSSAGETIKEPMAGAPGAGAPNPLCRDAKLMEQDATPENFESVGVVVRYGNFRLVDLGDLTWNQEHGLACPNNLVGTMTVFHTTRHGDPHSGAPQFVHAIRARVAVMNNGERKGGSPEYWQPFTKRRASRISGRSTARRRAARTTIHRNSFSRTSTKPTTATTSRCPCGPTAASRCSTSAPVSRRNIRRAARLNKPFPSRKIAGLAFFPRPLL